MPGGFPNMMGAIEPMQVDMPEENENDVGAEENEEQNYIVENPSLDLEAYSNAYTGLAKLHRLQFIAEHCPVYTIEALKLAIRLTFPNFLNLIFMKFSISVIVRILITQPCTRDCTGS